MIPRACGSSYLLIVCILFASLLSALGDSGAAIAASEQEAKKPARISVSYCTDCVPFQFRTTDGDADGLIIDYWKLWSKKTGIAIDFVAAPWAKTLTDVGNGATDAHAGLFYNESRDRFLDYGVSLTETDTHVFFHRDIVPPKSLAELAAFRVAVLADDFVEGWLRERLGPGSVVGYRDYDEIIEALRSREIKVFAADTPTALYHLNRAGLLAKVQHQKQKPLYRSDWFVATAEGNAALLQIINAGMEQINAHERRLIARTWASGQRAEDADSIIVALWTTTRRFHRSASTASRTAFWSISGASGPDRG